MSQEQEVFDHQIIRASAGSGKTYKLSERYLKLLLEGVPAESILATTFTRKAAGEIQDRILKRLGEGAASPEGAAKLSKELANSPSKYGQDRFRALTVKVVRAINRLRICTLDAFFMQLAGSYAFEIGLPPGWTIVDDTKNNSILTNAILKSFAQTNGKNAHEIARLLFKGELSKSIEEQVFALTQNALEIFYESQKSAWHALSAASWPTTSLELNDCIARLEAAELAQTKSGDHKKFVTARSNVLNKLKEGDWEELLQEGIINAACNNKTFANAEIPSSLQDALVKVSEFAQVQLGLILKEQLEKQLDAIWHVLDSISYYFGQLKSASGAYRFDDLAQKIAEYESRSEFVQLDYRLDSRTRHLLLDEFQDASFKQWSIIKPFAEAIVRVENAKLDPTDPDYAKKLASFFCVGDVKQAIYGWRGGVAEIFSEIQKQLDGVKQADMSTNWRSCPTIIEVVNKLFLGLCDVANPNLLLSKYLSPEDKSQNSDSPQKIETKTPKANKVNQLKREAVTEGLANWRNFFTRHKCSDANNKLDGYWALEVAPVYKDGNDVSACARKAIVNSDGDELEPIDSTLNADLSTFSKEEYESKYESEYESASETANSRSFGKQRDLTLAYAARRIKNLRDRYPKASIGVLTRSNAFLGRLLRRLKRLGVKASEEGGAPLVDTPSVGAMLSLFRLAAHPGDSVDAFNIANVPPLVQRFQQVVGEVVTPETVGPSACRRLSSYLRTLVETKGLGNFAAEMRDLLEPVCGDQRLKERLDQFVEFAFSYQASSPNATLDDFIKAAEACRIQAPSDSTVRVMTIHGSKGLEFDIVVLPELDGSDIIGVQTQKFIVKREGAFGPIESVMRYVNQGEQAALPDELLQGFKTAIRRNFEEALCLLYVAITRPRRMLLAIINPETKSFITNLDTENKLPSLTFARILRYELKKEEADPLSTLDASSSFDANPQRVYDSGSKDWGADLKDVGDEDEKQNPDEEVLAEPVFRSTERRRLLYRRHSPTDSRNPIVWKRPEIFIRGKCVHACYEQTQWLDVDGLPNDDELRRVLLPLANYDRAKMERAISDFHDMCRTEFTRLLMSRSTYETRDAENNPFFNRVPCAVANASTLEKPRFEVRREFNYRLLENGQNLQSGVVDRLVLLYDGDRLVAADVVDFKTDVHFPNPDLLHEYFEQLQCYGKAVEDYFGLSADKISLRLAFVTLKRLVDVRTGAIASFNEEENE